MKVIAVTPIKPGTILAPYSLDIERIVSEVYPCHGSRETDININRSRIQGIIRHIYAARGYTHVLLLDSDVVVNNGVMEKLKAAWKPGTTACARTRGATNHVLAACALLSVDDYLKIDYLDRIRECQCLKVPNPFYVDGAETVENRE